MTRSSILKIKIENLLFFTILINPILSLIFDNTNIHYYYILGPIITILVIFNSKNNKKLLRTAVAVSLILIINISLATLNGAAISDFGKINNHLFNYFSTVLLLIYSCRENNVQNFLNYYKRHIKLVEFIVIIINAVEAYFLVTQKGYTMRWSWGGTFYHGTNSMPHTLAYLMIVTMLYVCLIIIVTHKRGWGLFSLIPLYAIYESGARIALIMALPPLLIIFDLVFTQKQKNVVLKIIPFVLFAIIFLVFARNKITDSDLWAKIIKRQASGNTSAGRLYIWKSCIYNYLYNSSFLQYLFGQGDYMSYYYNSHNSLVGTSVWAHSDVVQILLGKGTFALFVYIYAAATYMKKCISRRGNVYSLLLSIMCLAAALLNGFYNYRDLSMELPLITTISFFYSARRNSLQDSRAKSGGEV